MWDYNQNHLGWMFTTMFYETNSIASHFNAGCLKGKVWSCIQTNYLSDKLSYSSEKVFLLLRPVPGLPQHLPVGGQWTAVLQGERGVVCGRCHHLHLFHPLHTSRVSHLPQWVLRVSIEHCKSRICFFFIFLIYPPLKSLNLAERT